MNTEECVPAQHFCVPVFEVEGLMRSRGCEVNGKLIVRSLRVRGVSGRLVVGCICNGEVGQSGNADGWRVSNGSDGRRRNRVRFSNGDRFEWRGLGDLRFEVLIRKPKGCGNGS